MLFEGLKPETHKNAQRARLCGKDMGHMAKKYIHFHDGRIYAIYYRKSNTIYYNLGFRGKVEYIVFK